MINRTAVIGLGLIGGSFALALQKHKICLDIVGYDQSSSSSAIALEKGIITASAATIAAAVAEADLIVLAVPVLSLEAVFAEINRVLWEAGACIRDNLVITDVGSVKGIVVDAATRVFGAVPDCLVPSHPIAGSEKHGVTAATADLFNNRKLIITPHENTLDSAVQLVSDCWQALGAEVIYMDIKHHDEVLAGTSHLPHFLAYALVDTLSSQGDSLEIFRYAAGGFGDFTRIAASDPVMWRDIFKSNGPAVLKILDRYMADLERLREALAAGDTETLIDTFKRAKIARDYFTSLQNDDAAGNTQ
ncbi:MAG: prephenate dehydrogenase/arogenate dehydrogenase family protein [Gammaproteobacteria bacterium]|nr:prephenate dehydrogenase/arogenate dehydrogenase family protein [Gammaproteobacteria bacterium]